MSSADRTLSSNSKKSLQIRPRFRFESDYSVEQIENKLKSALKENDAPCQGRVIGGHATLHLPTEEQHYWSPQLSITFEENNSGSLIRGLYGPRPQIWTMFVLFYSIIGFAALTILMFGLSYLSLSKSADILWLVPILGIIFLSLYLVSSYGQKLGHDQVLVLQKFIDQVLK
ncbi:MAG: hypothetical protein AAFN93_05135 [Bacteroidota bacterium]